MGSWMFFSPAAATNLRTAPSSATDAKATLKAGAGCNLSAVAYGAANAAIPLEVGTNALSVEVTAEDGTTKTYALRVERPAAPCAPRWSGPTTRAAG